MFESSFVGDRVNALHGISPINKAGQKVKYYEVRTLRSSFTLFEMFCKRAFPTLRDKDNFTEGDDSLSKEKWVKEFFECAQKICCAYICLFFLCLVSKAKKKKKR